MRKIVAFDWVSIDGYYAGPNGEIDWVVQDPQIDNAAHERMNPDTLLCGRVSYQMFENVWPKVEKDPNAPKEMKKLADEMAQMTKVVFSKTLKEVTWENSKLLHRDLIEEVKKLRRRKGADIAIFGSGTIVQQLANEGLIDEYLFAITPVVLGAGRSLFTDVEGLNLELLEIKDFKSGNVLLYYKAKKSKNRNS
jgi:dihydrofolate reductase